MEKTYQFGPLTLERTQWFTDADEAVAYITQLYTESQHLLLHAFKQFSKKQEYVDIQTATYPYLGIEITPSAVVKDNRSAYGAIAVAGKYGATLTRPDIFQDYYREQIDLLLKNHKCPVLVGKSTNPIPLPFMVDHSHYALTEEQQGLIQQNFVFPDLTRINDSLPNGIFSGDNGNTIYPIALFNGERTDFSLHRLHHYTGTASAHFQKFILLTNYQRYVREFIDYGHKCLQEGTEFSEFVEPGDYVVHNQNIAKTESIGQALLHLPQMPAYHLKRPNGEGITLINIGVGPTNAKTITDHLAVLRPHCWIMVGHCGGLRITQRLGDYVLAHAYVRDDHVLDDDVPLWVPIPSIAEIQVSLQTAVQNVTGEQKVKDRLRTGTVLSTSNRNWELRSADVYQKFRQSRAIAVDLESATIATNGFRFRVPYGTLLCVSDKPIHGEVKMRGMANTFYDTSVRQHLQVGLETIEILRQSGVESLHSRKLRGFDEAPFR